MARYELPTGTVTFLFTDVEGSTRLLHALGPKAYASELATHRRLLRDVFTHEGGVEVDTQGDAFFVAFPTATGAAEAASSAHAALGEGQVRVRIGLHTGAPQLADEGYVGEDVHRGARVAALAHGGQTLVSSATAALLDGAVMRDLGLHRLKDFEGAMRVYQLGAGDFPPLRTPGSIDLPTPATPFLGRQRELLDALSVVLDHDPRVLTIVGPGGTGKTRFAIELARLLADETDGGTVFLPLAPLRDTELLLPAVAERLGAPSADIATIAARIGQKRTRLLVDNVEQLLPGAGAVLAALTTAAPALRLLVTSREALRIQGEHELDLPPLVEDDAAELFVARARAVRPGIERNAEVDELCARLDRLPLAVELAAARMKLLTPEQILGRLSTALDLLRGTRDADDRHATLRATIAWSYDLLQEEERRLFAQFAVFRAGWTLEIAENVCGADVDTITSLLDKSLIRRRRDGSGHERFFMLETIREFARERLHELPDLDAHVRRRHALRMLEIAREAHLSSEVQGEAEPNHDIVFAEREDIRAALDWAAAHDRVLAAEIVVALEQFWVNNALREGRERVETLLGDDPSRLPPLLRAQLLRSLGSSFILLGDSERGQQCYAESLDLFRELGDMRNVVALLARFAVHAGYEGNGEEARRLVAEVRELNEAIAHPVVEPQMLSALASVAYREGDLPAALDLIRRSVDAAEAASFRLWEIWQLSNQQQLELELRLVDDVERSGQRVLMLNRRLRDRRITLWTLTGLAQAALLRNELQRAGELWGAVVEDELMGLLVGANDEFGVYATPLKTETAPAYLTAVEAGRALSLEQAAAVALGEAQTLP